MIALNDEVWGAMSAPAYEGEVRLGVPHDIVGPYLPPILRRFDKAWPRVRVSLKCTTTPQLLELLRQGRVDLTLTTEERCGRNGETLIEDELVWVGRRERRGAPAQSAAGFDRRREPASSAASVLKALADAGRDWRPVCEVCSMEPLLASIEADLAVGPLLRRTIPDYLQVIDEMPRLPRLPKFLINMYLPPARQSEIAVELARHIRQEFATALPAAGCGRFRQARP